MNVRETVVALTIFLLVILAGKMSKADALLDCVADERAEWSVIGSAEFVGEPWVYSWTITEEWNNNAGKMIPITPVVHHFPVPGEQLRITFEDGTSFTYGETLTEANRGIWADNLGSLSAYGMDGLPSPYVAAKWRDGSIVLLKIKDDGTCGIGWHWNNQTD
jgi:hypothetical protein